MSKEKLSPKSLRAWTRFLYSNAVQSDQISASTQLSKAESEKGYLQFNTSLKEYSEFFFDDESGLEAKVEELAERLGRPVDIFIHGAGNGRMARELAQTAVGVKVNLWQTGAYDTRSSAQKKKDARKRVIFQAADMHEYNPGSNQFDLVFSRFVLMHSPDPFRLIKRLYRSLRVGGEMYLHFPASYYPESTSGITVQRMVREFSNQGIPTQQDNGVLHITKTASRLGFNFMSYNPEAQINTQSRAIVRNIYRPVKKKPRT